METHKKETDPTQDAMFNEYGCYPYEGGVKLLRNQKPMNSGVVYGTVEELDDMFVR